MQPVCCSGCKKCSDFPVCFFLFLETLIWVRAGTLAKITKIASLSTQLMTGRQPMRISPSLAVMSSRTRPLETASISAWWPWTLAAVAPLPLWPSLFWSRRLVVSLRSLQPFQQYKKMELLWRFFFCCCLFCLVLSAHFSPTKTKQAWKIKKIKGSTWFM